MCVLGGWLYSMQVPCSCNDGSTKETIPKKNGNVSSKTNKVNKKENLVLAFLIYVLKDSSVNWRDDENLGKLMK